MRFCMAADGGGMCEGEHEMFGKDMLERIDVISDEDVTSAAVEAFREEIASDFEWWIEDEDGRELRSGSWHA